MVNGSTTPPWVLLLGVAVSVATSFLQSLGLTLQRKSHLLDSALSPAQQRPSYCRPLWLLGLGLFVVSSFCGTTLTIGLLPVIILAPLGAVTLISNALFAKWILGDHFSPRAVLATLLVVVGGLIIGVFGTMPLPTHSLEDLIRLYQRPVFIAYFSCLEAAVVGLAIVAHVLHLSLRRHEWTVGADHACSEGELPSRDSETSLPLMSPTWSNSDQAASDSTQWSPEPLLPTSGRIQSVQTLCGLLYGLLSGMISSQSLLFTKSGIELLLVTLVDGDNQFGNLLTWVIVGALVFTALLQLYYLNKGLELCDTLILAPLAFCSYNLSTLFNGLVYYDQIGVFSPLQLGLVILGATLLSTGVVILSLGTVTPKSSPQLSYDSPVLNDSHESLPDTLTMSGASPRWRTGSSWWDRLGRRLQRYIHQGVANPSRRETQPLLS
ncbi:hypothetical protein IWQ61_007226 [Dispira simplex]|nr:hypothetical protein IWQ61_007226 [Dispira simplex]